MSSWKATVSVFLHWRPGGLRGGPGFQAACTAGGQPHHRPALAGSRPRPPTPKAAAARLLSRRARCRPTGGPCSTVPCLNGLVRDALAANSDLAARARRLARGQCQCRGRTGGIFPGPERRLRRHAPADLQDPVAGAVEPGPDLQPLHAAAYHQLCARSVRRHAPRGGIGGSPGARPGVRAPRRASDACQQCRAGRHPVRVAVGSARGPAKDHRRRRSSCAP